MTAAAKPAHIMLATKIIQGDDHLPVIERMRLRMFAREMGATALLDLLAESEDILLNMAQEAENIAKQMPFDPAAPRFYAESRMLTDIAVLREQLIAA